MKAGDPQLSYNKFLLTAHMRIWLVKQQQKLHCLDKRTSYHDGADMPTPNLQSLVQVALH